MSLEEIQKLYGQPVTAPKTPDQAQGNVVDLSSPVDLSSSPEVSVQPKSFKASSAFKHYSDLSLGCLVRFHPGGRKEEGKMSTPKGGAWQNATFENGDSIDTNSCLL